MAARNVRFADLVDLIDRLPLDQRESLVDIVRQRLAEDQRGKIAESIRAARREHKRGRARPVTAEALLREILQ